MLESEGHARRRCRHQGVSILYLRCSQLEPARPASPPLPRFNSLFEMRWLERHGLLSKSARVSILYLRCCWRLRAVCRLLRSGFNSLFEMPVVKTTTAPCIIMMVSILYLRCASVEALVEVSAASEGFNSLFEMLDSDEAKYFVYRSRFQFSI